MGNESREQVAVLCRRHAGGRDGSAEDKRLIGRVGVAEVGLLSQAVVATPGAKSSVITADVHG